MLCSMLPKGIDNKIYDCMERKERLDFHGLERCTMLDCIIPVVYLVSLLYMCHNQVCSILPIWSLSYSWLRNSYVNDSLALVLQQGIFCWRSAFDVWVMNAQGVEVSWTKKFTIRPFHEPKTALGFRQNGEFLLEKVCGRMMSYHIETRQRKEYQVCGDPPSPKSSTIH